MLAKFSLRFLALTLALAMTPLAAAAQESSLDVQDPDPQPASQLVAEEQPVSDSGSVIAVLTVSTYHAALLAPPAVDLPSADDLRADGENTPLAPAGKGSGTGLGFMIGFMIGGAAALIGGLLIGGTAGTVVAVGGVGLGVYGAIIYF
jgi:hypothetical protein